MNKIKIQKVAITNFKGIRSLEVKFGGIIDSVCGANGSGKTTIADAICWVLTGNVYDGRSVTGTNVYIQPKENGKAILELPHIVRIEATLNDEPLTLQRESYDHFTSIRGSEEKVFDGFENKYLWNDVKVSKTEYENRLKTLCSTSLLPLINPSAFSLLPQSKQRDILMEMAGEITWKMVAGEDIDKYVNIMTLLEDRDMDQLLAEIRKNIAMMKVQIETKTHQAEGNLMNIFKDSVGEEEYRSQLAELEQQIQTMLAKVNDAAAALEATNKAALEERNRISSEISKLNDRANEIDRQMKDAAYKEYDAKVAERHSADMAVTKVEQDIAKEQMNADQIKREIASIDASLLKLGADFDAEDAKPIPTMAAVNVVCPHCGSEFELEDSAKQREQYEQTMKKRKEDALEAMNQTGEKLNADKEAKTKALAASEQFIAELSAKAQELKSKAAQIVTGERPVVSLITNEEYRSIQEQIAELRSRLAMPTTSNTDAASADALRKSVNELRSKADTIKAILARYEHNNVVKATDEQLQGQIAAAAAELAEMEQTEIAAVELARAKYSMIEDKVNGCFTMVRFQMFERCMNGTMKDKCQAIVDGVEICDANNADKINGGIDICNALQIHYGCQLPIIVDNAESVTSLMPVASQIIRLQVDPDCKVITMK